MKDNKYYIYGHVRLDTNEIFYIGRSKKKCGNTHRQIYNRAYNKKVNSHNKLWCKIVREDKIKYKIIILYECNSYENILEKEKEYIKLYGRKDILEGTLVNLSDGGVGSLNYIVTEDTKLKMKQNSAMKDKCGEKHHNSKMVYVYNIQGLYLGSYGSIRECSQKLNLDNGGIHQVLKNKIKQFKNYRFFYSYKGEKIECLQYGEYGKSYSKAKKVCCYDDNFNFVKEFESITKASKFVNTSTSNIAKACKNKTSFIKKYYWRYKDDKIN